MESPSQTHDLESGPETATNICDTTQSSRTDISSSLVQSAGTTADLSRTSETHSHLRNHDTIEAENMFAGDAGQALLLAFKTGKGEEEAAILVPVCRPSIEWARSMEMIEKKHQQLPVTAPKKEDWDVERWREFRWLHRGENEVNIWNRIRKYHIAQRPRWYSFLPFWRPVLLEEREILLHSQAGDTFRVEIEPALDLGEKQKKAEIRFDQASEELAKYMPDEYYCNGDFDVFGEWFAKYHDIHHCRKGTPIDDYSEHDCDVELFRECQSKQERMKRRYDFMNCFEDPSKANTVFPLTAGRVLGSCIHDKGAIRNRKLPSKDYPNRLPPRINGLVIEYSLSSTRIELETVASSLFISAVVLVWKLAMGDWNVAVALGGLCVALMTFGHQRSKMAADAKAKTTKID